MEVRLFLLDEMKKSVMRQWKSWIPEDLEHVMLYQQIWVLKRNARYFFDLLMKSSYSIIQRVAEELAKKETHLDVLVNNGTSPFHSLQNPNKF